MYLTRNLEMSVCLRRKRIKLNLQASTVYQFQSIEILQSFPPISMLVLITVEVLITEDAVGDILMLPMLDEEVDIDIFITQSR
jgi:hypothetical protein